MVYTVPTAFALVDFLSTIMLDSDISALAAPLRLALALEEDESSL